MNADFAAEMLNGREMFLQKSLFVSDWYHSTEIFLIRSQIFIALWSIFFDNLLMAHRLAVGTEIVLQILAMVYMFKRLQVGPKASCLGLLVFFGLRTYESGLLSGLAFAPYASIYILCFLTLGYYAARREGKFGFTEKILSLIIPILALIFGISSIRVLVILFVPVLVVHFGALMWSQGTVFEKRETLNWEIVLWSALCLVGNLIRYFYILPKGFGPYAFESSTAQSVLYVIQEGLPALFRQFIQDTGLGLIQNFNPVLSLPSISGFLSLFFYGSLIYLVSLNLRAKAPARVAVFQIMLFSLFLSSFIMVFTMTAPAIVFRYLLLFFAWAALAAALAYETFFQLNRRLSRLFLIFIILTVMLQSFVNYRQLAQRTKAINVGTAGSVRAHVEEIEKIFKLRNLTLGYALFWDSYPLTVLTNGRINIAAVRGDFEPFKWTSAARNFSPSLSREKVALIVPDKALTDKNLQFYVTKPSLFKFASDQEHIDDPINPITIYFFDQNYFTLAGIKPYALGTVLSFVGSNEPARYFRSGLSGAESTHTWSLGTSSDIEMPLDRQPEKDLTVAVKLLGHFHWDQTVVISVDGERLGEVHLRSVEDNKLNFTIPKRLIVDRRLSLRFDYPNAVAPSAVSDSKDARVLAIAFGSLVIDEQR